jgi:hypothetical protein
MKKTFILTILITVFIVSCNEKQEENDAYSISEEAEYVVNNDVMHISQDSLSNFDEFALIDSFLVITDEYSDTVVRLYKNLDFSKPVFYAFKGKGPRDILGTVNVNRAVYYDTIAVFERDAHRIKKVQIDKDKIGDFKADFFTKELSPTEFNMTKNYVAGVDINSRKIFIYNKQTNNIVDAGYFLKSDTEYDEHRLKSLHICRPVLNEEKQTICAAMYCVNSVNFLNLQGELKKTVIIGDNLNFPKPDAVAVSFPNEKIYFVGSCGTQDYIYCLYYGIKYDGSINEAKIFVFNWEGEHITTIQTNGNIFRITADKNNKYLLALLSRNNWTTTDIVKIPLEGILKK